MQNQYIDKLTWLHIENGRVLVTRSKGKDTFYMPGGKREAGESDQQALAREISEELSVTLDAAKAKYIHTFEAQAHGRPEGTLVRMTCYEAPYEGELKASAEIEEIDWFGYADRPRIALAGQIIFDWLKQRGMME
jgi:8-oxo-dGTP pyrophosphatase MutT (NUDIX family)